MMLKINSFYITYLSSVILGSTDQHGCTGNITGGGIVTGRIWDCVMKKMDTYEGNVAAYNTSPVWRSLLTKSQTKWMLEGIFPFLAKYLRNSDVLNCRQVCNSWKNGVDSYLQTDRSSFSNAFENHEPYSDITKRSYGLNFNRKVVRRRTTLQEVLASLQTDFIPSGVPAVKNPFISRSVNMTIREINPTVEEFFKKFGAHLQCLVLHILCILGEGTSSELQVVQFVWQLLSHIPNLKQLALQTNVYYSSGFRPSRRIRNVLQRKLLAFYKRNSAPPLPQLRGLALTGTSEKMHQVLETAYGSQRTKYVRRSLYDPLPPNLTNLTKLGWNFYSSHCMEEMSQLKNLECPTLQQLGIYVKLSNPTEYRNNNTFSQLLFEAIERFKSSVTHLEIIWTHLEPNFPAQLNMPLVQEFSLRIAACESPENLNLSFLQGFRSLRKLKCVFSNCSYTHFVEIRKKECLIPSAEKAVDLHYYLQDDTNAEPYKSNFWRLLASLDMIKIQVVRILRYPFWFTPRIVGKTYTRVEMN